MSIRGQLKKLTGETFIYGVSGILSKFISFFLIPFYARKLSQEEYGDIALLNSVYFFISVIACLGLDSAVYRWYFDDKETTGRIRLFNLWFSTQFKISVVLIILASLVSFWFGQKFLASEYRYFLLALVSFNILLNLFYLVITEWLRINLKAAQTVLFSLTMVVLSFLFSAILILYYYLNVLGFFLGQTIALTIITIMAVFKYPALYKFIRIDKKLLGPMLKYGLNIIPATLCATVVLMVTNFIIQSQFSSASLGLYQMGNNLAAVIMLLTSAFATAWSPFSFSIMNDPSSKMIYAKVLEVYFSVICVAAFGIALLAPEALYFIATSKFSGSAVVAGILAYHYFISSLSTIAITGLAIAKKVEIYSRVVIFSGVLTILAELALIRFDKEGLALGMLIGQALIPILLFYFSQKKFYIPYNFYKITIVLVSSLIILYFGSKLSFDNTGLLLTLKFALVLLLFTVVLLTQKKAILSFVKIKLKK